MTIPDERALLLAEIDREITSQEAEIADRGPDPRIPGGAMLYRAWLVRAQAGLDRLRRLRETEAAGG